MVMVLAIAVPIFIAPVPESTVTAVFPVWLPITIGCAIALAPNVTPAVPPLTTT